MPPPPSESQTTPSLADLSTAEFAALEAIVRARWAWSATIYLVAAGHDVATLESLEALGVVERWDLPEDHTPPAPPPSGPCLTLTPFGAELLGVDLVEEGPAERPRWARMGTDERGRVTANGMPLPPIVARRFECRLRFPIEQVHDPAPGPEFLVDEADKPVVLFAGESTEKEPDEDDGLKGGVGAGPHTVTIDPRLSRAKAKAKKAKGRRKAS